MPFFYYSSSLLLDNHHLSTDNIKFISQQIIIAKLRRGFDSGIDLFKWSMPVAATQYLSILQFRNWYFMENMSLLASTILLYRNAAI